MHPTMSPFSRPIRALLSLLLLFLVEQLHDQRHLQCHAYTPLSDETLLSLPDSGSDFHIETGAILAPILRPRVSGTTGSAAVREHITNFFAVHLPKWNVELHKSTSETPVTGEREVPFVNIIATRDPPRSKAGEVSRLVLAAHYDSKLTPKGFIGATDSAAPCAMLLHVVRSLDEALTRMWVEKGTSASGLDEDKGIQVIFFDGEEAFGNRWTDEDSLYGSRALAESWETAVNPAMSTYHNKLSSISMFLLLDLLGAKNPVVPSFFRTTHWAYELMAKLEGRLRSLNQFRSSPNYISQEEKAKKKERKKNKKNKNKKKKKPKKEKKEKDVKEEPRFLVDADGDKKRFRSGIEDDHVPFMERGVEVLHIIPSPFPSVWHKMSDNGENLDMDTVEDWARLVTAFTAEWMDLDEHFNTASTMADAAADEKNKEVKEDAEDDEETEKEDSDDNGAKEEKKKPNFPKEDGGIGKEKRDSFSKSEL